MSHGPVRGRHKIGTLGTSVSVKKVQSVPMFPLADLPALPSVEASFCRVPKSPLRGIRMSHGPVRGRSKIGTLGKSVSVIQI